jgi:hypothetical protein
MLASIRYPYRSNRNMTMKEKLDVLEAYKCMFEFLREYYYRKGKPDELGDVLSDIQLLESNIPADPAMWEDWIEAVEKVLATDH